MIKFIYWSFRHLSMKDQITKELRAAREERLHATAQREYWVAMESMLVERVSRLSEELEEELKNAQA